MEVRPSRLLYEAVAYGDLGPGLARGAGGGGGSRRGEGRTEDVPEAGVGREAVLVVEWDEFHRLHVFVGVATWGEVEELDRSSAGRGEGG